MGHRLSGRRVSHPTLCGLLSVFAAGLLAAGCQTGGTQSVSLEQAKRLTATFQGAFTPPPKTVNDIVTLVEQDRPEDAKFLAEQRNLANRSPPTGLGPADLARFYAARAGAADLIGRSRQKIEDSRKTAEAAGKAERMNPIERIWLRWGYGQALLDGGDPVKARAIFEALLKEVPLKFVLESEEEGRMQGHSIAWFGLLAATHGLLGDLAGSERAMKRVVAVHRESASWVLADQDHRIFNESAASSRATVLDLMGKFAQAELEHRKALDAMAPYRGWNLWLGVTREQLHRKEQQRRAQLAINLSEQGRLPEAESEARAALQAALETHGRYTVHSADMLQSLGTIVFAEGRYEESEWLARTNLARALSDHLES
jgi:hypothetical protein